MIRRTPSVLIVLVGLGVCLLSLIGLGSLSPSQAAAAPLAQETTTPPAPSGEQPTPTATRMPNLSISDEYCLDCHKDPAQQPYILENGDPLDMFVDPAWHQNSVHGEEGYACVQCHTDVGEYPHPAWQAADRRDATLKLTQVCARCHQQQASLEADGVHAAAQTQGIREAAVCVDCHTSHEVRRLTDPETGELLPDAHQWIPERCALCHNAIYEKYKESVHGTALSEGNQDVPTCIDCHGVHNIENPTTAYFRLNSPKVCADCHSDEELMGKYNVNTNVLNTYVADFHGSTVAIFEKTAPDAEVNKAVCYDCHGVHDISAVDDPQTGLLMQENLLHRCQVCHPDATANFPTAWMSHYNPSPENYPLVYYVNLFYILFIPLVLGGMGVLVVMDASRMALNWRSAKRAANGVSDQEGAESFSVPPQAETGDLPAETAGEADNAAAPPEHDQPKPSDSLDTDSEAKHE